MFKPLYLQEMRKERISIEKRNPQDVLMEIALLQTAVCRSLDAIKTMDPDDLRLAKEVGRVALSVSEKASGWLGRLNVLEEQVERQKQS